MCAWLRPSTRDEQACARSSCRRLGLMICQVDEMAETNPTQVAKEGGTSTSSESMAGDADSESPRQLTDAEIRFADAFTRVLSVLTKSEPYSRVPLGKLNLSLLRRCSPDNLRSWTHKSWASDAFVGRILGLRLRPSRRATFGHVQGWGLAAIRVAQGGYSVADRYKRGATSRLITNAVPQ
jgi:hypothetical protein